MLLSTHLLNTYYVPDLLLGTGVQGQNMVVSGCRGNRQTSQQVIAMWPDTCCDEAIQTKGRKISKSGLQGPRATTSTFESDWLPVAETLLT